jgi:DNA modification methylase
MVKLILGDCLGEMRGMEPNGVDAIVTDPPYGLAFMGKDWDHGIPGVPFWAEALRVAKPGCHLLAFGGTRTFHRLACAIEDAGWEIRDTLMWVYGSGFPKSHDVSKAIDKAAGIEREIVGDNPNHRPNCPKDNGADSINPNSPGNAHLTAPATEAARQWEGWGTALKPAWEPIIMARKPLEGTVAANVQKWGCGAMNIDGCRVGMGGDKIDGGCKGVSALHDGGITERSPVDQSKGRWPANLLTDGSEEVLELFPETGSPKPRREGKRGGCGFGFFDDNKSASLSGVWPEDIGGSAARFFYCCKASRKEREMGCEGMGLRSGAERSGRKPGSPGLMDASRPNCEGGNPYAGNTTNPARNHHPTVKPLALMRYLCRLVTPPNGTILDPFMGSGTTGMAAKQEGFQFIGIEKEKEYVDIAERRIGSVLI